MDLSDAYANSVHIAGGAAYPARWAAAAAAFRALHPPEDIAYGDGPRERLHLFRPEANPRGLVTIVHGGYWMALGRDDVSHLAAGCLARGWAVAVPSYPLAPEARIGAIVGHVARAVDEAAEAVAGPVVVTGHSAGGHIAARLACADVALACRPRLARIVAVSPLAMLLSLLRTEMNATLRLDVAEALAESPALRLRPTVPVTAWVGEAERPVFRLQAEWLARAWGVALRVDPGRHHFDVIEGFEAPDHPLVQALVG